jgi:spermidine synthase
MKKRLIYALLLIGFTSMAAQIVLMRELLVVFYGNELSLGITLASWLFWIALGSWGPGRWLVNRLKSKLIVFVSCEIVLAFILPLTILAARFIPAVFQFSTGEIIGILPMSAATFILLFPICILGGFLFVLGCEIYRVSEISAVGIGWVYILEAAGASFGGLLTSLFLIRTFSPLYIMVLLGILNLLAAFVLLWRKKFALFFTGVALLGFLVALFFGKVDELRNYSLNRQWRSYELLTSQNSVYGNIAVTRRRNLFSVFTNGLYEFSVPDRFTSEMDAHFPLLEHPAPRRVLLIGGGSSGQLREVLKHPVEHVDYVELDPLVIELAKKYLPPNKALADARVKVITNMDGRLFIKRARDSYDVIIINLPEPHTAQVNRFYTEEFYREAKKALAAKGILSFRLASNPNYISAEQVELYATLKNTLEQVFPEVKITPGQTNYFFAARQKGILTLDWRVLMERLRRRNIQAKYMREYYLFGDLTSERIEFFTDQLEREKTRALNRDFYPIAYYYDMVFWNTFFKYNLRKLFRAATPAKIYAGSLLLYLLIILMGGIKGIRRKTPHHRGILTCVATTGFAEIAFQIVTLLSFQVLYGYVYYKLGIILTSYMLGLIVGGWLITRRLSGLNDLQAGYRLFMQTQVTIFLYPLILPVLFWVFSVLKGNFSFFLGSNIVFPLLPIIPGLIGGFQFPLANSLYIKTIKSQAGRSAGLTYGLDLFGSCLGAVLASVFLIPIVGIPMTCILVAGLNLIGLTLLLRS